MNSGIERQFFQKRFNFPEKQRALDMLKWLTTEVFVPLPRQSPFVTSYLKCLLFGGFHGYYDRQRNDCDEHGVRGDEVRLTSVNEYEDSLSTNMWRLRAIESTRAAQFRDVIATSIWNDH
ncbi:uncharacterized protein [Aristolochia californica]|uniref:uncharacterized protein isoform X2 n=1 Tax=Aristolochia californica TaxID=171875 RepID=UPI0035D85662